MKLKKIGEYSIIPSMPSLRVVLGMTEDGRIYEKYPELFTKGMKKGLVFYGLLMPDELKKELPPGYTMVYPVKYRGERWCAVFDEQLNRWILKKGRPMWISPVGFENDHVEVE